MNGEFMYKESLAFIHLGILLSDKDPLVECSKKALDLNNQFAF